MMIRRLIHRHIRLIKFLAIGVLNTIFGYSVYALVLWLGGHYTLASIIALVLGTLFNFKTTGFLVFGSTDNMKIFRFIAVYSIIYLFNISGLSLLTVTGLDAYTAGILMIAPQAFLAYFLNSRFVFSQEHKI